MQDLQSRSRKNSVVPKPNPENMIPGRSGWNRERLLMLDDIGVTWRFCAIIQPFSDTLPYTSLTSTFWTQGSQLQLHSVTSLEIINHSHHHWQLHLRYRPRASGSQDLQALQLPSGDPLCLANGRAWKSSDFHIFPPRNMGTVADGN